MENTDYTIDYQVVSADGMNRKAEMGTSTSWGTTHTSGIFVEGDTVKATFTPMGDKAGKFNPLTITKSSADTAPGKGALSISARLLEALNITVTAPAGSTISLGRFGSYWIYQFEEPLSVETVGDTVVAKFRPSAAGSMNHFVRVQHPDGVTYWTFDSLKDGQSITVTKEDLHIGDASFTKDTVNRFNKNVYDLGNVYLNINEKGYLNLEQGQTRELDVFRCWQAIEGFVNAKIALPDVHYTVVDLNGQPSDVVTITPDANNSSLASMRANKNGTALVLVTYDAMTHMQGQSSTKSKEFSAIWPEFTGVFVVSVGADGSAIQTNMTMDRMDAPVKNDAQKALDAEHDILFYLGDAGASYSFKPEEGCTVTVARSTVTDKMRFSGFTSKGVTVAADGTVTVTGLTTGRHII